MNLTQLLYFIKLCRPVNLLIIAVTMYLMEYKVIGRMLTGIENENQSFPFPVGHFDFFLLVFSTLLIAGAGYIINDYFDIRIDRINKPDKVIVGKYIKKRVAMLTHTGMNVLAVAIGLYLSIKYGSWVILVFHFITTTLLWWYSVQLKRKFLSGNVVIAILSGMVPLITGWFVIPIIESEYSIFLADVPGTVWVKETWIFILGFTGFAALTTLVREIIKDMADIKGDAAQNCKTIPIVLGLSKAKYFVNVLLLGIIFSLLAIQNLHFPEIKYAIYIASFICLPLLITAVITHYAHERNRFLLASAFIKISMLAAVLFTILL